MLEFQLQQAPMRLGLAEGADPHQVPFGTLTTAENVCWDKSGRAQKRYGTSNLTTSISGGGNISAASRLITRGSELAVTDGSTLYSYSSSLVAWQSRGRLPEIGLSWDPVQDSIAGAKAFDVAYLSNGQLVQAWATGDATSLTGAGDIYYQIVDSSTGAIITSPTLLDSAGGYRIRVLASGTSWVVLWTSSGGALKCRTSSGTTSLKTDACTTVKNMSLDACIIGTEWVVAYALLAGGVRLVRYSFAGTPVQQATATVTSEAGLEIEALSIAGASGETLYIGYFTQDAKKFKFAAANPSTLAQTVAPTVVDDQSAQTPKHAIIGLARETSTTCIYLYSFYTISSKDQSAGVTNSVSITNAGAITRGQTAYFTRLLSRPFFINSRPYAILGNWTIADTFTGGNNTGIAGSDLFLVDATVTGGASQWLPFRQVGKIEWLIGGIWGPGYVSQAAVQSGTLSYTPAPYLSNALSNYESWRQGVKLVSATVGSSLPADMWRALSLGQEACISAGVFTSYDGIEAIGYGWPHGPQLDPSNTVAAGGGSMAAGNYIYSVTAERRSSSGMLYRSPIATPTTVAVGASGQVTVAIVPVSLAYSQKEAQFFPIYRTVVAGTVLQRRTIEPSNLVLLNAAFTSQPMTVVDSAADSNIGGITVALSTRPALYTEGGELEDFQPPACLTQAWHQSRFWLVLGDGRTVAFSKDYSTNPGVAPGFHPTMVLTFEKDITAIHTMDDKLIAFGSETFWYIVGQGPAPNGQGGSYDVGVVQSDVGCVNPRSIASVPMGLFFQSSRGIYLLSRSLEASWIGRPVKDEIAAYPNITSAVVVAARNEVRWTANNAAGTAGIVIIYNYVEDQWTTSRYTVGGVYGAPIADACLWNGVWTFVTTSGQVCTEDTTTYLDGGSTWVPITIETAWINQTGPLSFQSVRKFALEGVSNSNHDLTLSVAFDNETSYVQTKTFAAGSAVTSIGPLESCELQIGTRRKCQAIRFKIQDATPTNPGSYPVGTGQGPSFDTIGIEVGGKRGFVPKPATKAG